MKNLEHFLRNRRMKKKLGVLVGFLAGGIIIMGAVSFISSALLQQKINDIAKNWMPSSIMAQQLNTLTSDYRMKQYGMINAMDEDQRNDFLTQMEEISDQINAVSAEYESLIQLEEDRALLVSARSFWNEYMEAGQQLISLAQAGQVSEAAQHIVGDIKLVYDEFQDKIDELVAFNEAGCDSAVRSAELTFIFVVVLIGVVIVLCLALAVIITKIVASSILTPMNKIRDVLGNISAGTLDVKMNYDYKDEFGDLAGEVNSFADSMGMIIKDTNYLLTEMAGGNFNIKTNAKDKYVGEYETILLSMRAIRDKLGSAMEKMAESSDQVLVASEQMAQEAQSLSDGATEQAGTVQELLASVEEAATKASMGAKQASNASNDAKEAKTQAESSNERMREMIHAMDLINQTSKEIASIIQTIEGIATQTNLLSLNASIEAARAGEAGRGFAVVADEIGKLALQCSDAAGNTRRLIETSMKQAENGDKIAKDTAAELGSVMEGISKIADVAEQVKISFENQAESMRQIDEGIELISKVVESNSAAAEESSAASEELAANAQTLQDQMSQFKFID